MERYFFYTNARRYLDLLGISHELEIHETGITRIPRVALTPWQEFYAITNGAEYADNKDIIWRWLGETDHPNKIIRISWEHIQNHDTGSVIDTLIHEAAHALLPVQIQHGDAWAHLAKLLGGTGKSHGMTSIKELSGAGIPIWGEESAFAYAFNKASLYLKRGL